VLDDRGASQVLGAVLLIGVVITGSLFVVVLGSNSLEQVRDRSDNRQANTILQELDSRFSSLVASSDTPQTTFDLGSTNPKDFVVRSQGYFTLTVNRNPRCSANVTMSSVRFENDDGRTVAYEGGGVWERAPATEGSSMLSAPSVTYRAGTIDAEIINISGTLDQDTNVAQLMSARSDARSAQLSRQLTQGECMRPDNATIAVTSTFYRAWGNYIESEFGVSTTDHAHNQTVVAHLEQADLPERVNDSANNVVNLSSRSYNTVTIASDEITVDKDAGNVYAVSARPLQRGSLHIGNITKIEADAQIERRGMDVVFVLDKSGSMSWASSDPPRSRIEVAQEATHDFVGGLNASKDRAGLVEFSDNGYYNHPDGRYLTTDFEAFNDSVTTTTISGTHSDAGLSYANNIFDLQSDESKERVMILLTDGRNDGCDDDTDPDDCERNRESLDHARDAAANGVTVYTIGYGDDDAIDEAFLKEVANVGNGNYYQATDADELATIFDDIRRSVSRTQAITRAPISTNFTRAPNSTNYSSPSRVYAPQAAGNVDRVATVQVNGEDFANINDPTAESQFSHTFAVTGGDTVAMEAYDYDCDEVVDTGRRRSHAGTVYRVARCSAVSMNTTITPSGIYHDGDDITHILTQERAWWQDDLNETFVEYDDISVNSTTTAGGARSANFGTLDLKSNQALVWYDLPDGEHGNNRLLMLYEIGLAESDAQSTGVINVRVNEVDITE